MGRTKKLWVALLVCLSVLAGSLGLVACSGNNSSSSSNSSNVEQSTDSNVSSEEENGSEEENSSDDENSSDEENSSNEESSSADEEMDAFSQGLSYTLLDDDTYEVTGIGDCTDTEIIIPRIYNKKSVTRIGDLAFYACSRLTSVTIPDSVTSIGMSAFDYCDSLTSVTIPDSVTSIGLGAFSECGSLTYNVKNNLKYLGNEQNPYIYLGGVNDTSITSAMIENTCKAIGYRVFENCRSLTSVVIPDGVTSIDSGAFYFCDSLTSVTIPEGVTSIGALAFSACDKLQFNVYDNAKYLGSKTNAYFALIECENQNLSTYTIHNDTKVIAAYAFAWCDSLTSIEIPSNVTSIGYSAFYSCDSLTSIEIPDSVASIEPGVFLECRNLTEIKVDKKNTKYKDVNGDLYTKDGTTLLQYTIGKTAASFTIPDSVTSISFYAFAYCSSLTSIEIPDSVISIGEEAFFACRGLTSVVIGDSVTSIDHHAFSGCDSLTSVTIGGSVTSIGKYAFSSCNSLTSITIPDSVTSIGDSAFVGSRLINILVGENNPNYKSIDGNLYSKDGKTLFQYARGKTNTFFVIVDSVTSIGNSAFRGCSSLTSIEISDSVTSIGLHAFYNCSSLTNITFNGTIEEWNAIKKSVDWKFNVPAKKVVCSDGEVAL